MRIKTLLLTLLISTSLIGTSQALTFVNSNSNSNNNSSKSSAVKKATNKIPPNAFASASIDGWSCKPGYIKIGGSCKKKQKASALKNHPNIVLNLRDDAKIIIPAIIRIKNRILSTFSHSDEVDVYEFSKWVDKIGWGYGDILPVIFSGIKLQTMKVNAMDFNHWQKSKQMLNDWVAIGLKHTGTTSKAMTIEMILTSYRSLEVGAILYKDTFEFDVPGVDISEISDFLSDQIYYTLLGEECNSGYIRSERKCAKIPANASASSETSWKCNSGYIRSGKSCAKIPDNASASGWSNWKCNSGYIKSGKSCAKIPANASASSETSWKCNSGYIRSGKSCAKIPDNASASGWSNWKCNSGYIKSGKSCAKIPDNASASGETSWKCDSSYYKNGNVCLILPANAFASSDGGWECNSSYYKNDKVCIPLNSSASGDGGWKCNPGYFKSGKRCAKIPANASASSESSWKCNSGYIRSGKSCAKIPDNASASSESSWKCNSGYIRSGKSCAKIPDNASVSGETSWKCNAPFKQSGNFCITIPLNASVSGDGGWECDSGTKKIGDICKILQVKNLHFYYGTNNTDELDFSSANFCDLSPKVQLRNSIFYLPNKEEPYSGKNLCVYLKNGQYYSSGDIEKGFRQGIWSYWHHNGQKMAKGSYLDGVPVKQWNFWDENGEETRDINISESKINTANKINDMPKDTIDYRSEEYLGKLSYCLGVSSTHSPELAEKLKPGYIIIFEELFPGSDIKNIVKKGFDLGKKEFALLDSSGDFDFDEMMSNADESARVAERCYELSKKFTESITGVGGYRP